MNRILALLLVASCTVWKPVLMEPMSKPIQGAYEERERKKVSDCDFVLLQVWKFGNGQRMEGMYQEIKGNADAVIEIVLDRKVSNYWLFGLDCYTMYGTPITKK